MDGPVPERDGGESTSSDGLAMDVTGDAPGGRVSLTGELDVLSAPRLEQLLTALLSNGYRRISVDASGLTFLAAAGLNVLCRATRRYREAGGRLQLVAVPQQIRRLLLLTGLDTSLDLERSAECEAEPLPASRPDGAVPAPRTPAPLSERDRSRG